MAVAFFIVAHSDDWFLFMGKQALDAIGDGSNGNRIGFVYVTATNFVDGSKAQTGPEIEGKFALGLRARESATIATALSIFGRHPDFPEDFPDTPVNGVNFETRRINGRDIAYYSVRNTFHYCLRLPDGDVDGTGSAWTGNQSLMRLRRDGVPCVAQGPLPARYETWNDLTGTLRAIFDAETAGETHSWLNYLDPNDSKQPFADGHPDHFHVALAVEDATRAPSKYGHARFRGYTTVKSDGNEIDQGAAAANLALLTRWDDLQRGLSENLYTSISGGAYLVWVRRQELLSAEKGRQRAVRGGIAGRT
jgi:LmbE family N-acetylglucosaminyl deacetylase